MRRIATFLAAVLIATTAGSVGAAETYDATALGPLLNDLPKSKLSLAESIRLKTTAPETAISAKFEMKKGKLMLSVYTVQKGLHVDAEHNVLMEYLGSPETVSWNPDVDVFDDVPHVARAAMQLTLMSMSPLSLTDVIERAGKDQPGTVFSAIPKSAERTQYFEVLVADQGKVVRLRYDVLTGKLIDRSAS